MKGGSPIKVLFGLLIWGGVAVTLPGPCDRSRRVLTAPTGVLSTGPVGANYTQVTELISLIICVCNQCVLHNCVL